MKRVTKHFIIEDQVHCEQMSDHRSLIEAQQELERLATVSWDAKPNLAPCGSWETCGREYVLIEGETIGGFWRETCRTPVLEVDAKGVRWKK
jgi:hypothetical protein